LPCGKIVAPVNAAVLPVPSRGEITFENVTFAYPTRPQDSALHGLSFKIAPGEMVAIVGPSGAGKTTLFQLLSRFYDASSGRILLDDIDIKTVDPAELRRRIKSVPQDPVIFAASIADNIRYGHPEASDDAVRTRQSGPPPMISSAPCRRATRRSLASAGDIVRRAAQRIAIARAILQEAPVLLLDEATSALDSENEAVVQEASQE